MGEKENKPFQLSFNGFLQVDFRGSRVTSDGEPILVRELDERLGLGQLIDEHLTDSRRGANKKFPLADLLRRSVYSRLAGYEDLNDAVRVSADPTFRLIGSKKNWDRGGALTSRLQSFEAELLASDENLIGLMAVNRELVAHGATEDDSERVVPGMHSTQSPVHGRLVKHAWYYWLLLAEGHLTGGCSATCCTGSGRCRCRVGSVGRTRIHSFWLQKTVSEGALSAGAPFRPLNHCLLPEVMCRVQRGRRWYWSQRGCLLWPCQGQNGNPGIRVSKAIER